MLQVMFVPHQFPHLVELLLVRYSNIYFLLVLEILSQLLIIEGLFDIQHLSHAANYLITVIF